MMSRDEVVEAILRDEPFGLATVEAEFSLLEAKEWYQARVDERDREAPLLAVMEAHARAGTPRVDENENPCSGCGSTFPLYDKWGRPRRFASGHNIDQETMKRYTR